MASEQSRTFFAFAIRQGATDRSPNDKDVPNPILGEFRA